MNNLYHQVPYPELIKWDFGIKNVKYIGKNIVKSCSIATGYIDQDILVFEIIAYSDRSYGDNYQITSTCPIYQDLECLDTFHGCESKAIGVIENEIRTRNRKIKIDNILKDE